MFTITKIQGREIIDSRGNPTIEAEIFLSDGPNSWPLKQMYDLLETLLQIDSAVKTKDFIEDQYC